MKLLLTLLVIIGGWIAPNAGAADIREDMAAFDRAYIPLLTLTTEGLPDEAFKALNPLRRAWTALKDRHYNIKTTDTAWRRDFELIEALIFEGESVLDGRRHLELARVPFERVRVIMMELRRRNGIDYYLDYLVAYHEPMAGILRAARGKEVTEDAAGRIRALIATASETWERALAAKPGPEFRLTAAQRERLQGMLGAETAALVATRDAFAANGPSAILVPATRMETAFDSLYNAFGEFHGFLWEDATRSGK